MLRNNKFDIIISIIAAIALWTWVTMAVNPPIDYTVKDVPVELINLEALYDKGLTVDKTTTYTVDVTVSGPRSIVNKLTAKDVKVTADMTGYQKGLASVRLNVIPPAGADSARARTAAVDIEVVDRITVTKPVRLVYDETFAKGMEPGFIQITPDEMEVAGTVAAVDAIDYIKAEIPKGGLSEEENSFSIVPIPVKKDGKESAEVDLSQDVIKVTASLCYVKTVPLVVEQIGTQPTEVEITALEIPETITIRGSKEAIKGVSEVRAEAIDLSRIETTAAIPLRPFLPQGVEEAEASKNISANVEVEGVERKEFTFTADQIEVVNLREGLFGHVGTGSVVLTVLAPESVIKSIVAEDIRVFVDAASVAKSANGVELPLQFEYEKKIKNVSADPENVRVSVSGSAGW